MVTNNIDKEKELGMNGEMNNTPSESTEIPSEEAMMDENMGNTEADENNEPTDDSNIQQYFPNVEVTDANREELSKASEELAEYEVIKPKFDKLKEQNRKWISVLNDEPELAQAMMDTINGGSFWANAAKYVDLGSVAPAEGEPEYANVQKRLDNLSAKEQEAAKRSETEKRWQENEMKSAQVLEDFKNQNNIPDEQFDKFCEAISEILNAFYDRNLSVRLLNGIWKEMNWDSEMENNKAIGEQIGKAKVGNARIADLQEKELANEKGDGMPDLMGAPKKEPIPKSYGQKWMEGVL